jgi:hypothetical protein
VNKFLSALVGVGLRLISPFHVSIFDPQSSILTPRPLSPHNFFLIAES